MAERLLRNEPLYRAVPDKPQMWKSDKNRPTSALFKDERGVSVSRACGRVELECLQQLRVAFPNSLRVVSVDVDQCHEIGAQVYDKPNDLVPCHAEIHRNEHIPTLTSSMARKLALAARVLEYP